VEWLTWWEIVLIVVIPVVCGLTAGWTIVRMARQNPALRPATPEDTGCRCTGWDGCPNPTACGTHQGCHCGAY
jgi:hypothetical protein